MVTSDFTPRLSNAFLSWKSVPFSPEEVPLYSRLNVSYKKKPLSLHSFSDANEIYTEASYQQ
jgi:hypothetical protein